MSIDEHPVALPKLYGAPAYARPPAPVAAAPRPFDPDALPLQAFQTEEDRHDAASMPARAFENPSGPRGNPRQPASGGSPDGLRPQLFRIRQIAGRLLGGP